LCLVAASRSTRSRPLGPIRFSPASAHLTRLGADPQVLLAEHREAFEALRSILKGKAEDPTAIGVALKGITVELTGPFATGSTFSENLLLEYTNGLKGASLGWGRLTRENLNRALEIHTVYADLMRRQVDRGRFGSPG
jgi:hypothetical protein